MSKKLQFILCFIAAFILDQWVKQLTLGGMRWQSEYFDLTFALNTGIAFSMLSFLDHYLKYFHLVFILILVMYLFWQKKFLKEHIVAFGIMLGSGCSNLLDRFVHGGVVDMFFWHKWFNFAIFNVADVMINISVALIFIQEIFIKRRSKNDRMD
ncbi:MULTISPECIES: signal peptidase II [Campylobacter]|uniref:Lipoprotein signal peptidase n=1 Tax=Campylobacter taeniopygiae TaxID=2510188 RepID=A0ABY2TMB4_9BACT|nr:signal peptidase II [Campylobacter taeniopygiae]MBZ7935118.1 lipoprotein signal peptidase [Campylobacter sp. B0100352/1]TKX34580.1 lipoprotein signal peptidase [Campylobacter taeniopygiae]